MHQDFIGCKHDDPILTCKRTIIVDQEGNRVCSTSWCPRMMFKTSWGSTGRFFALCLCTSRLIVSGTGIAMMASAESVCNPFTIKREVFAPVFCAAVSRKSARNLLSSTSVAFVPWLCAVRFLGSSVVTAPWHPNFFTFVHPQRIRTPFISFGLCMILRLE